MRKEFTLSDMALIGGFGILIMALTVPFAEFYIFPKLITDNAIDTTDNLIKDRKLFTTSIFLHFITLICDIIVAWALYVFFKPVSKEFFENVVFYLDAFKLEWSFGLIIFAVYLMLLGYLAFKSEYVPRYIGVLIIIAGVGYFAHTLGRFIMPDTNLDFLFLTFFGELIFMIWLLIKGRKLKPE